MSVIGLLCILIGTVLGIIAWVFESIISLVKKKDKPPEIPKECACCPFKFNCHSDDPFNPGRLKFDIEADTEDEARRKLLAMIPCANIVSINGKPVNGNFIVDKPIKSKTKPVKHNSFIPKPPEPRNLPIVDYDNDDDDYDDDED